MYFCTECDYLFEETAKWEEKHDPDNPLLSEDCEGCPKCFGFGYIEAFHCDVCMNYITGTYIKTDDGDLICDSCYVIRCIGEDL